MGAGAQDASVARIAVPARPHWRRVLGFRRDVRRETSSKVDRGVIGSVGSGVAKGFRRHVTAAMRKGVGKNFRAPACCDEALVVATPGAAVLEIQAHVSATKRRRRWRPPMNGCARAVVVASAGFG